MSEEMTEDQYLGVGALSQLLYQTNLDVAHLVSKYESLADHEDTARFSRDIAAWLGSKGGELARYTNDYNFRMFARHAASVGRRK